ncbi:MAG: IS3 family transposase [Candidatus Margulisbacteria bacterium]|nr:IS3 family transposase [Candidatus Margulisiibacteriota bacterium]
MSKKNCAGTTTVAEKRAMVDQMKQKTGLKLALEAVGLPRSSYYYERTEKKAECRQKQPLDPTLKNILLSLKGYELTLGYRKTMDYIDFTLNRGHYNHKKVYRHMFELKMLQPKRLKKQSKPKSELAFYSPLKSNVRWEADLTYVFYGTGTAHAFVVIDTYDKEVIGKYFSMRARAAEAVAALDRAVANRFGDNVPEGFKVTMRVDRGCQYTAEEFCLAAKQRPWLVIEYCGVQAPNDKPYVESWFACYKREEVYRNDYQNFWEAKTGFESYISWYNNIRPHGSLRNISPATFRAGGSRGSNVQLEMIERLETEEVSAFQGLFLSRN